MEYSPSSSTDNTVLFSEPLSNFAGDESKTAFVMEKKTRIRKMYLAAFSALLLAVSMGLATGYSAPATYDMAFRKSSSVKPNKNEITWIGSILALGAMVGGVFAGTVADKIGRKDTLIFTAVPAVAGWLIICYAKTVIVIIIGRFLSGAACAFIAVTVPMYCVEISTAEVRGRLGSLFQGFAVIGNLLSVIIGTYVSWEMLALNGAVFTTFAVAFFCFMPKSPRWLLAKGRVKEAIKAMNELQGGYVNAENECNAIYKDLENQPKGLLSFGEFKQPSVYLPTAICLALFFFHQASGYNAVIFYSSNIFEISKDFLNPKKATIVLSTVQVVATLTSNIIVDKVGRKILLILSGLFMALSHVTLGIYYFMSSTDTDFQIKYGWISLVSLVSFVLSFSSGFGPVPYLLVAEMIPVRARSTVGGVNAFLSSIFAFIITKTFSELEDLIHNYGTFWFYSYVSLAGAVFVFFIVPETKGKQLEEIEKIFCKRKENGQMNKLSVIS